MSLVWRLVFTLHVVGLSSVLWQSWMHLQGKALGCATTASVSCDVMFSSYGYWFSIPVPFFALAFYVFSLGVSVMAWRQTDMSRQHAWVSGLLNLSLLGLFTAIYFAVISWGVLKKFCPYCSVFYAVALILAGLVFQIYRSSPTKVAAAPGLWHGTFSLRREKTLWGLAILSALILGALATLEKRSHPSRLVGSPQLIQSEEARSLGPISAPFQLVEFSDFQCPHCRKMAQTLKQLERESGGTVRITYKFYPLDPACNAKMPPPGHPVSCKASKASVCAAFQNKFWVYHDLLFAYQERLGDESLWMTFARDAALDLKQFESCLSDRLADQAIQKDMAEADALGISGTPTLFINGRLYEGDRSLEGLKRFLQSL